MSYESQHVSKLSETPPRTMLFYRNFRCFSGGHLKYWHYYLHALQSAQYKAQIFLSKDSVWSDENPWLAQRQTIEHAWRPYEADVLFLAGLDWRALAESDSRRFPRPIINLIQGVRHAEPSDPRYTFLGRRAIRICVSQEIADALQASRKVNGPIFVNPNGIDVNVIGPQTSSQRRMDVLIAGLKQPNLARTLHTALLQHGIAAHILTEPIPRSQFLSRLEHAAVTVFLPEATEGFYLPALEGMALGTLVICPDCVGNRSFCLPEVNCLQPTFDFPNIVAAVRRAVKLSTEQRENLLVQATSMACRHSLARERDIFCEIVDNLAAIW